MKIKPGQFEVTHYSDQDQIHLSVDPMGRRLEWLLLVLFILFLAVGGWAVWFICTMN